MAEAAIINASPLIFLSRSHYLRLLESFAREVWVPQPGAEEILRRGPKDFTARAIKGTPWLLVKSAPPIPTAILDWRLGPGESSVLALTAQHPGAGAIIDDLAARKCAVSLGLPVRGTLGIVLVAKQRGLIFEARPVTETLLKSGLYLSKKVLEQALQRVGEA